VWDGVVHVKPEVSAPGVGILSTVPGGDLAAYSGTSMATPFVAATAALLKEYAPGLSVQELKETIQRTAIDLGQAGPDTRYGHGRLDALAALVTASGGSLVRGAVEGELGRAVRVHAKGRDGRVVKTVETNPDTGRFHMVLPAGSYTLEANLGTLRVARREIVAAPREIMELNLYPVAAPDSLDHLLVYPNPFKPEEGHTTVNFAGLPDGADVTIYTFSGAVVRELSASGGLTAWDGRDESGRWMGSGLYFYLATHRSDESGGRLHKKGKLALIR
jgi:hypothetical protein